MSERYGEDVFFILTKDEVLDCANELGISQEKVTGGVIELVKREVNLGLGNWPEIVKKALKEATGCPLGLVCYPSCSWWQDGKCTFTGETKSESGYK